VIPIHQRDQGVNVNKGRKESDPGFQEIFDGPHGHGLSAGLAFKSRYNARSGFRFGRWLKSLTSQIGQYPAQALRPFLSEMFGDFEDVFVKIDGGAHGVRLAS